MGRLWIWVTVAAGLFGIWWAFFRVRPAHAAPTQLGLIPPGPGQIIDSVADYFSALAGTPAGGLPPVPPTQQPSAGQAVKSLGVQAGGYVGAAAATSACLAAQGGPLCALAAPAGKIAGQYAVTGAVWTADKVGNAAQAVGGAVVSGVKKLKFWD